jgi:hypothetical protein
VAGGHGGEWAAKIANTGKSTYTEALVDSPNWITTTTSGTYMVSGWVRGDSSGRVLKLQVVESRNGSNVGTAQASVSLTTSWQVVNLSYLARAPSSSTIDIKFSAKIPARSAFYVDDVSATVNPQSSTPLGTFSLPGRAVDSPFRRGLELTASSESLLCTLRGTPGPGRSFR